MPSTSPPKPAWVPVIDGPALRRARTQKGLSQRDLIRKCADLETEIDPGNLQRAETSQRGAIGIKKLPAVVEVLGINMADVLTDHGLKLTGLEGAA